MWTKSKRIALISAVYQNLFWSKLTGTFVEPSWEIILEQTDPEEGITETDLQTIFSLYREKQTDYSKELQVFVRHWDKTFDIVKACLFTFMMEVETAKNEDKLSEIQGVIIGKYIRLTQELAGGENPGLIHAITSKILESKI